MTEKKVYVVTGGGYRYVGEPKEMKRAIEHLVKTMVSIGSGVIIIDASPELTDFLLKLQKRYPWTGKFEWPPASLGQQFAPKNSSSRQV